MSTKQLSDHRTAMSLDEAKTLFNAIAMAEIKIEKTKAQAEARIAKIKADTEIKVAEVDPDLDAKKEALADFIMKNTDLFKKPRNQKTSMGQFGLQKANKVVVVDKKSCTDFLVDQKMTNCFEPTYKLVKKGIMAAIEAGSVVVGAKLLKGDIAHYKVSKTLLDEAKKA